MGSISETIEIQAPVEQVWQAVRYFHNADWAPHVITQCEAVGDRPGDEVGASRIINGMFRQTLLTLDDAGRTFTYSLDKGPAPVSNRDVENYVGRVTVRQAEDNDRTLVEWSSSWEGNDEAASDFLRIIYRGFLVDMRQSLE